MADLQRYCDLVVAAAQRLRAADIDSPQREARLLMGLAAGLTTTELIICENDEAPEGVALKFDEIVQRRAAREPFAHIAGYRSFYGLDFVSDARALVPRPDSERVVELTLERLQGRAQVKIADLGTGSGCLLVTLLKAYGAASGVGVEVSASAASLARENVARHDLRDRARIIEMSWADWTGWGDVDLIVSNPPYIVSDIIETLAPEVALYDPAGALDGGVDGLGAYREIISLGADRMKTGAHLVLEIGYDQKTSVSGLLERAGFTAIEAYRDLNGHDRVVVGIKSAAK